MRKRVFKNIIYQCDREYIWRFIYQSQKFLWSNKGFYVKNRYSLRFCLKLYLCFVSDECSYKEDRGYMMFADDIALVGENQEEINNRLDEYKLAFKKKILSIIWN